VRDSEDRAEWTDEELFRAARQDDSEAFVELQYRLANIFHFIKMMFRLNEVDIDMAANSLTIYQQTLRVALEKAEKGRLSNRKRRKKWLLRIARNEFYRWLMHKSLYPLIPPTRRQNLASPTDVSSEQLVQLADHCFDCMPGERRTILKHVLRHGRSMEDAANQMGVSTSEAEDLYYAALSLLNSFIENNNAS
jgi:DNA-directed RNA polymerase specialized sigma24 family protein